MDNTLTNKEQCILTLVQQGMTNSKITVETGINPTKLYYILRSIKDKLGVNSKQELIALAEKGDDA